MNLPSALLDSLEGLPGFDRTAFIAVHEAATHTPSIRLNPGKPVSGGVATLAEAYAKTSARPVDVSPIAWCADGYHLHPRPSFTFNPYFHAGGYYVQEASSMFLGHVMTWLCGDRQGLRVLDLCAAPGGKSTQLASLPFISLLVSNEVIRTRVAVLFENIVKWGAPHVFVSQNDPSHFSRLEGFFDVIVVDAPCSGSGLFRRDAAAVEEWSLAAVDLCSQRQQRILADALPALKEGGMLIYSTCSYSRDENEDVLDWLASEQGMSSVGIGMPSGWGIAESISGKTGSIGYRFYPDRLQGEGFFLAAMRKEYGRESDPSGIRPLASAIPKGTDIDAWIDESAGFLYQQKEDDLIAVPVALSLEHALLAKHLHLRKSGTRLGKLIRGKLNPDHELAMSTMSNRSIPSTALSHDDAIRYLRKDVFIPDSLIQGWNLMTFGGLPLGFMKCMPSRANNYYPADWRIRSQRPG
jgi:16S rRNA C967 or C1407 C5-methylase (RsmB/RsmF family)/NOL1/NOP2/fmu family ribosome biogenesis protein